VAVFKNGEIAEYGSHDELMARNGLYRELFTMQAQFYEDVTA
jgi:ABC-type multidrug transport system fused ATPase/permease subunit